MNHYKLGIIMGFIIALNIIIIISMNGDAFFNPAVAIIMYLNNKINIKLLSYYIIAEILGSITALFIYNHKKSQKITKITKMFTF